MNIVLIGYRGTGKSEVAAILCRRLKMECISMDEKIVERVRISIPEIVDKYGWAKFRDLESEVAEELSELDNIVIDTGGGVIERAANIKALGKNSLIVWLKASVDTITARIEDDEGRPALTEGKSFTEEVAEVLERRTPKYKKAAHEEIDTDPLAPEQVAEQIIKLYHDRMQCG